MEWGKEGERGRKCQKCKEAKLVNFGYERGEGKKIKSEESPKRIEEVKGRHPQNNNNNNNPFIRINGIHLPRGSFLLERHSLS